MRPILIVLPTSKLSGGALEVAHVEAQIRSGTHRPVQIATLFGKRTDGFRACVEYAGTSKLAALLLLPLALIRLAMLIRSVKPEYVICTHAITWPLALCTRGIIFVQALEWKFFKNRTVSVLAESVLAAILKRADRVVVANRYLNDELTSRGIAVYHNYNVWVSQFFAQTVHQKDLDREFDVIAFLRPGPVKRLDRYREVLDRLSASGAMIAAVCWNDDITAEFAHAGFVLLKPMSQESLKALYKNSRFILMLSEHEGFALPPLEAMAAGCVPIATRCGGPESYIEDGVNGFLVSNDIDNASLAQEVAEKYLDKQWEQVSEQASRYVKEATFADVRNFLPALA